MKAAEDRQKGGSIPGSDSQSESTPGNGDLEEEDPKAGGFISGVEYLGGTSVEEVQEKRATDEASKRIIRS